MRNKVRVWFSVLTVAAVGMAVGAANQVVSSSETADAATSTDTIYMFVDEPVDDPCPAIASDNAWKKFIATSSADSAVSSLSFCSGYSLVCDPGDDGGITLATTMNGRNSVIAGGGSLRGVSYKSGSTFGHGDRADLGNTTDVTHEGACFLHKTAGGCYYPTTGEGRNKDSGYDAVACVATFSVN